MGRRDALFDDNGDSRGLITDERDVITPLPPIPPVIGTEPSELLTGDLARAYSEFQYAARELEGKHTAFQSAQERYRVALAKFTKLATGG